MSAEQSFGLQSLLQSDAAYAARYAEVVHETSTLPFDDCIELYKGEFSSWKNRKAWCKANHVEWEQCLITFKGFLRACGPKPAADYTLDRIDHKGPYLLSNLRWASPETQNNNKGNNVRIGIGDELLTITEIATRSGKSYDAIRMGIHRHGEQWAVSLLSKAAPAIAAEAAWQFPEQYREELEPLYKKRTTKAQTRLRFFLDYAKSEYRQYRWKEHMTGFSGNGEGVAELTQICEIIRDHNNAAVKFLLECHHGVKPEQQSCF
jgi:hypothetical protein